MQYILITVIVTLTINTLIMMIIMIIVIIVIVIVNVIIIIITIIIITIRPHESATEPVRKHAAAPVCATPPPSDRPSAEPRES